MFVGCPEGCRYHTASAVYYLVLIKFVVQYCSPSVKYLQHVAGLMLRTLRSSPALSSIVDAIPGEYRLQEGGGIAQTWAKLSYKRECLDITGTGTQAKRTTSNLMVFKLD